MGMILQPVLESNTKISLELHQQALPGIHGLALRLILKIPAHKSLKPPLERWNAMTNSEQITVEFNGDVK